MKTRVAIGSLLLLMGCVRTVKYEAAPIVWTIDVQGTRVQPQRPFDNCVDISGDYPGFLIQSSQPGRAPTVCLFTSGTRNLLVLAGATIIATDAAIGERTLTFEHPFTPGPNGRATGRAEMRGVFTGAAGTGVPTGNSIEFHGYLVQDGQDDLIEKPLAHQVGGTPEAAVFSLTAKEEYLVAGQRTLRGVLGFTFTKPGQKLVLAEGASIALESVGKLKEKTEEAAGEAAGKAAPATKEPEEAPEATPDATPDAGTGTGESATSPLSP
jgi:hypothetical protein